MNEDKSDVKKKKSLTYDRQVVEEVNGVTRSHDEEI